LLTFISKTPLKLKEVRPPDAQCFVQKVLGSQMYTDGSMHPRYQEIKDPSLVAIAVRVEVRKHILPVYVAPYSMSMLALVHRQTL
jgi:hypothetical protein